MTYDNTNTGTLFKNDTEGKSENFPPYGGTINVEGVEFWVSAWVKEGKRGKFFSLALKPKEAKQPQRQQAPARRPTERVQRVQRDQRDHPQQHYSAPQGENDFADDEIPF